MPLVIPPAHSLLPALAFLGLTWPLKRLLPFTGSLLFPSHFCPRLLVFHQNQKLLATLSSPALGSAGCSHPNPFPSSFLLTPCHSLRKQQGKRNKRSQLREAPLTRKRFGADGKLQMAPPFGCGGCGGFTSLRRHCLIIS